MVVFEETDPVVKWLVDNGFKLMGNVRTYRLYQRVVSEAPEFVELRTDKCYADIARYEITSNVELRHKFVVDTHSPQNLLKHIQFILQSKLDGTT